MMRDFKIEVVVDPITGEKLAMMVPIEDQPSENESTQTSDNV